MIEVQLVNSVAPFVYATAFRSDEERQHRQKTHHQCFCYGRQVYRFKEDRHPHTNMAKAALNMLTHTAAGTLAKDGIL
jgi:NAD(P)-dependent dehydrogenase (short-subunit alcohol dehydrogenase family)